MTKYEKDEFSDLLTRSWKIKNKNAGKQDRYVGVRSREFLFDFVAQCAAGALVRGRFLRLAITHALQIITFAHSRVCTHRFIGDIERERRIDSSSPRFASTVLIIIRGATSTSTDCATSFISRLVARAVAKSSDRFLRFHLPTPLRSSPSIRSHVETRIQCVRL